MLDRAHIVAAIETYCRAETEKDHDSFVALFSREVIHEDPVGVATRRGPDGIENLWSLIVRADVELWLTDDVIVRGNEAIGLMKSETGPADARRRSRQIVDHFVFDEAGKITSVRAFYEFD